MLNFLLVGIKGASNLIFAAYKRVILLLHSKQAILKNFENLKIISFVTQHNENCMAYQQSKEIGCTFQKMFVEIQLV